MRVLLLFAISGIIGGCSFFSDPDYDEARDGLTSAQIQQRAEQQLKLYAQKAPIQPVSCMGEPDYSSAANGFVHCTALENGKLIGLICAWREGQTGCAFPNTIVEKDD